MNEGREHRHILPILFGKQPPFWYYFYHRHHDTAKVPDGPTHMHLNNGGRVAIVDVEYRNA